MSRYAKSAPGGRRIVLCDGYHLCARCGNIHCTEDRVVVVYRTPWWGIHTHLPGPNCPLKAVSGWRAVELALNIRESNVPTPRGADCVEIGGLIFPFVSLLDDEHCRAEVQIEIGRNHQGLLFLHVSRRRPVRQTRVPGAGQDASFRW